MEDKEKKIKDINEIKDLAVMVLSHLDKIHSDNAVDDIINLLQYTPLDSYEDIFIKCKDFKKNHGKYPDHIYLSNNFSPRYYYLGQEYSHDIYLQLISCLKKYKQFHLIQNALENLDYDEIKEIISNDMTGGDKSKKIDITNISDLYKEGKNKPKGLAIGIPEFDNYTKGLSYKTLNVLSAPPGNFKTTTAISACYNACFLDSKKIIYLTLEITPEEIYYNFLARHAYEMGYSISASDIKKYLLSEEDEDIIFNVVRTDFENNMKGNLEIIGVDEIEDYSETALASLIKSRADDMGGLDLLCLDYLNLLKGKTRNKDPYEELNKYVEFFRVLCIKMDFIMLMLCQVHRTGLDKLEQQAKKTGYANYANTNFFAEANALERAAATATVLHATKAMRNEGKVNLIMVKNRHGVTCEDAITANVKPDSFLVGTIEKSVLATSIGSDVIQDNMDFNIDSLNDNSISSDIDIDKELSDED